MAVNLRRIRHDSLLTQEELADRSGLSAHSLGLTFRDVGGTHAEPGSQSEIVTPDDFTAIEDIFRSVLRLRGCIETVKKPN